MAEVSSKRNIAALFQERGQFILPYILKKWRMLLIAFFVGGVAGFIWLKVSKPIYTATYNFVLLSDRDNKAVVAGLASQLGFDGITSAPDNIFTGDNIIELFDSRKLISAALLSDVDSIKHKSLLNHIFEKDYNDLYKQLGAFGKNPSTYSLDQLKAYWNIITDVGEYYVVFKKDKKLIFYIISASSTDPQTAFYLAKHMLDEASRYFIETKTKTSSVSVKLLQHEADSLSGVIGKTFNATATMTDRTYNLNPSLTIQRSGLMYNDAKISAIAAAYIEVMRNLEIAKINLQKETPLYRIIDEPELPLQPDKVSTIKRVAISSAVGAVLMAIFLAIQCLFKITT